MEKNAKLAFGHTFIEGWKHKTAATRYFAFSCSLRAILCSLLFALFLEKTTEAQRHGGENWISLRFRISLALFLSLLFAFSLFTRQSQALDVLSRKQSVERAASPLKAKKSPNLSAKVKFSFGYDNNVLEHIENREGSRFYQIYVSSGMYMLPSERTLLSLRLQDGIKYLDAPSLSDESVLINSLNFCVSHRISERLIPEIQSEIRGRTSIHSDSGALPSEEAYLRGSVGAALKAVLLSDVIAKAFYRYKLTNFEDFDPFDRQGHWIGLRTDVRLLPDSTLGIQYIHKETHFGKWGLVSSDGKTSRTDTTDDISLCVQFYKYFLFDIAYSYQNNGSDADGYSYGANRFALLLARSFPRDLMIQLYALVRSKKYRSESDGSIPTQVDLEDDERGILTIKLAKDISEDYALEAQYDLRRSRSFKEDGYYTKGVFSFSLSFHF